MGNPTALQWLGMQVAADPRSRSAQSTPRSGWCFNREPLKVAARPDQFRTTPHSSPLTTPQLEEFKENRARFATNPATVATTSRT